MQLPPLAAVRAFEAAARHLSFTRAAAELGMTQAAVSYQIKTLEQRTGTPLFRREHRRVALTEAGARLAPVVSDAFARMTAAFAGLRQQVEGVLSISAVTTLASNWLAPRIGAFQLAQPGLAVRLEGNSHLVDFDRDQIDMAIRLGTGPWSRSLRTHRLFLQRLTPVCSPSLAARLGPGPDPRDLLRLPLIEAEGTDWSLWFDLAGVDAADRAGAGPPITLETQQMMVNAAAASAGVALIEPLMFPAIQTDGRLVRPFDIVLESPTNQYWLVYPEARRNTPKIRAFRDWILAQVAAMDTTADP